MIYRFDPVIGKTARRLPLIVMALCSSSANACNWSG